MAKLILMRHGESEYNKLNKFTGWEECGLTPEGINQAKQAGEILKDYNIGLIFISSLERTKQTMNHLGLNCNYNVVWQLNGRDYGDLTGMDKNEAIKLYGETSVKGWEKSFRMAPPNGEHLRDVYKRVIWYYEHKIKPKLSENILIISHEDTIRALIKYFNNISDKEIEEVEVACGKIIEISF